MKNNESNMKRVEHGVDFTTESMHGHVHSGTVFIDCNFEAVDMSSAQMDNATFVTCNLTNADLSYAQVMGAKFHDCEMMGLMARNTCLFRADLSTSNFSMTDITNADLRGARLGTKAYVIDRMYGENKPLTAMLTPTTLHVNDEYATHDAWAELIDEHPDVLYRNEIKGLLVLCKALRNEFSTPVPVAFTTAPDLESAA